VDESDLSCWALLLRLPDFLEKTCTVFLCCSSSLSVAISKYILHVLVGALSISQCWLPQALTTRAEAFGKGLSPESPVSSGEGPLVHPLVAGWIVFDQVALPC
jgi:hypothetical protein